MAHLEDPALAADLTVARDFDLGMTGPPLSYSMDFIAGGLVGMIGGLAAAVVLFGFAWWAPLVLAGAWLSTHWLLRESAVWRDRNTDVVRSAQRDADYAYRLAVDPPASKELRLFGLVGWTIERFIADAHAAAPAAVRGDAAARTAAGVEPADRHGRQRHRVLGAGLGGGRRAASALASSSSTRNVRSARRSSRLAGSTGRSTAPRRRSRRAGGSDRRWPPRVSSLRARGRHATCRARDIRFRNVTFAYPGGGSVLDGFDLTIPAGSSLAIVGQNGAGKTTLAKLLCRLYDPQGGAIEVDGIDLRELDLVSWRSRLTAVFQDFLRLELSLRDNVAPRGAPDDVVREALQTAARCATSRASTRSCRARYPDGTDLSGGQWQRVALARALCAVRMGAGVVLLDEPTAQLDVRGEAEIFERILAATRHCTTILISHRFSTVRHADRICVLERGKVVELGTHDELMALNGRYRTMFDLQAQAFQPRRRGRAGL